MAAKEQTCFICNNEAPVRLRKGAVEYRQCTNCKTLFSDPIDQDNMIGGEHEVGRNQEQNHLRIARIDEMVFGSPKDQVHILDFGCGHGYLIEDLKKAGYPNVDGYDAYNPDFSRQPERKKYHIVTAVEVIEHTNKPYIELDVIWRSLLPGGCVMIETSFIDVAVEEKIPLEDFFYIAPQNGHSTIFSHHGLDLVMVQKGFLPRQMWNRHVRLYQKPIE